MVGVGSGENEQRGSEGLPEEGTSLNGARVRARNLHPQARNLAAIVCWKLFAPPHTLCVACSLETEAAEGGGRLQFAASLGSLWQQDGSYRGSRADQDHDGLPKEAIEPEEAMSRYPW